MALLDTLLAASLQEPPRNTPGWLRTFNRPQSIDVIFEGSFIKITFFGSFEN